MNAPHQKLKRKYKQTVSVQKKVNSLGVPSYQLRLPHPALPGVYYETFSTREAAEAEKQKLLTKLNAGEYIPHVWLKVQSAKRQGLSKINAHAVLDSYIKEHKTISESDKELAELVKPGVADVSISLVNYEFAEASVHVMRTACNWSPSSIQKRVGCLGRAWAWFDGKIRTCNSKTLGECSPKVTALPHWMSKDNCAQKVKKSNSLVRWTGASKMEKNRA